MVLNDVDIFKSIKVLLTESAVRKSLDFKTAAWALMEMLTTTVLELKQEQIVQTKGGSLSLFDGFLENVYNLQIEQLHDIAQIEQRTVNRFVPELPRRSHPIFKSAIKEDADRNAADGDDGDEEEEDDGDNAKSFGIGVNPKDIDKPTAGGGQADESKHADSGDVDVEIDY